MMTCYLDANVVFALYNQESTNHIASQEIIANLILSHSQIFISSLVLDEYIHNSIRFSKASRSKILKKIRLSLTKLSMITGIMMVNPPVELKRQQQVINLMNRYGLRTRDAYHLLIMLENRIDYLATFDRDFDSVFKTGKVKKFEV